MLKISIVIPSYNQGQFIEETIRSVVGQQYPALELIVVDGGSEDESTDIIKRYEMDITWWVSEKDSGQSEAINKGLKRATGDILTWINSDDLLLPGALQAVQEYFSILPAETGLIHGGTALFRGTQVLHNDWGYSNPSLERNLAGIAFPQPSAFFLRSYFEKAGGAVNEQLHYGMDYDLFCRLACLCNFLPVTNIFSKYRLHDKSKSVAEQNKFIGDWTRIFVNLCKNLGWNDLIDELKDTGFFDENVISFHVPFTFKPDDTLIARADKKKILFYHLCYLLKAYYWNNERNSARRLLNHLQREYSPGWLKSEKDIPAIMKKLSLPEFVLKIIKRIKGSA